MKLRTLYTAGVFIVILINHCTAQGKGCFVSNIMISCLSFTCDFGGTCPGDPDAICRVERPDKCAGCEQVWYRKDGTKAECGSRQNLELCPGGEPVVHCKVDSCKWPCTHPAFTDRPCRQSFCGKCSAEYLFGDQWLKCPKTTTGFSGETLPVDLAVRESTTKACMHIPCPLDACVHQECLKFPDASCRPDGCNKCMPAWYLGNRPVNCVSGEVLPPVVIEPIDPLTGHRRICPSGEPLMQCTDSVCVGETCPNYPRAVCRPDGCGQCKATWYDDNVLVDCYATECPANVMRVKCIVDPCVYFGHYCPAAECRASECGRCEAKFFVGQKEISCVQPPKQCLPGENTMVCPWYTCNTNVCPSNLNLMCRINPCGLSCQREWVNVKTGEIEPCRPFEKRPTNKHTERIFMEDPLMSPYESNLLPGEKPYIEVKKDPMEAKVKTLKSKSDPLADQHFAVKESGSMAIPIPMKTPLHAGIKHEIGAMVDPLKDTVLDTFNPNVRTIPVPMNAETGFLSIPIKAGAPIRIQHELGPGHTQINSDFGVIPTPVKSGKPTGVQLATETGHIPINFNSGTIPVPMKAAKPTGLQHELTSGFAPIDSNLDVISGQMKAGVPTKLQHEIAALPTPLKESRPAIGADGQLAPMLIPMKHKRPMLESGPVSDPVKHGRPIESPMLIPASIYPGQGNVAILGANDPELNSFLLQTLGAGSIDNFPVTAEMGQQAQSMGLLSDTSGVLPPPMKANKPSIQPLNNQFQMNSDPNTFRSPALIGNAMLNSDKMVDTVPIASEMNQPVEVIGRISGTVDGLPPPVNAIKPSIQSINNQFQMDPDPNAFRSPALLDNSMSQMETIPVIDQLPLTENVAQSSVLGQHSNFPPDPNTELINNIPLPLKKKAGKPTFGHGQLPMLGAHSSANPSLNDMSGVVPAPKPAAKPQTFKPLYPELGLIQEKASNERFQQFLKQTGAHKNVPIKNDNSKPMPIRNAIPPLERMQWNAQTLP